METSSEDLLQHLAAEQYYAEQHLEPLQHSAALLRREILARTQAQEVPVKSM